MIGLGLLASLPSAVLALLEDKGVVGKILILGSPRSNGGIRGAGSGAFVGAEKDLEGRVKGCEFNASVVRACASCTARLYESAVPPRGPMERLVSSMLSLSGLWGGS